MRVALGVTGGVAAYKAAELVRRLQQEKLDVQVVMTRAACEFITPLTFAALTGQKVITSMFGADAAAAAANVESAIEHIAVAQRIDLLLIAPATADILAKLAHGVADDFLTTLYLATKAPVVVAPAMNVNMWEHPATQQNVATLRARGVRVVDPSEGYLACGMTGAGRLAPLEGIAAAACEVLGLKHDFAGQTVLVTAGPTQESIDPARYISNRSSGKMGYALADAAQRRGAHVVLVSGPTDLPAPEGVDWVPVKTAAEMRAAVLDRARSANIVIKAAAVSDYRVASPAATKMKRESGGRVTLELEATTDILAELGAQTSAERGAQVLIGFAAETDHVAKHAREKLARKGADIIIANDITQKDAGFDTDTNIVTLFFRDGREVPLPKMSKFGVANQILDRAIELRQAAKR
ncbi:MAG: bifunctional phosphopantothenoylcysteine decarboxylase/phosphopantothenate--cysteine ligase CoaBC [Candidatus Acidiferrales bacterium]